MAFIALSVTRPFIFGVCQMKPPVDVYPYNNPMAVLALILQVCAGRAEASVKALPTGCGKSLDSPDLPSPQYHL